ncbi:hypothetical protein CASFOL_038714 [Castilleja foliolosa]|uniref:Uncharacterized protein n=1 Tax=Castilleja foliolosa TaxID=1961234 RepID=A0ABD3BMH9_9LAMI
MKRNRSHLLLVYLLGFLMLLSTVRSILSSPSSIARMTPVLYRPIKDKDMSTKSYLKLRVVRRLYRYGIDGRGRGGIPMG